MKRVGWVTRGSNARKNSPKWVDKRLPCQIPATRCGTAPGGNKAEERGGIGTTENTRQLVDGWMGSDEVSRPRPTALVTTAITVAAVLREAEELIGRALPALSRGVTRDSSSFCATAGIPRTVKKTSNHSRQRHRQNGGMCGQARADPRRRRQVTPGGALPPIAPHLSNDPSRTPSSIRRATSLVIP
jgi:hypothetical protein